MRSGDVLWPAIAITLGFGCTQPKWDGRIHQWGAMREVLDEGLTQARVRVEEVTHSAHSYAVGALEGLAGEVTVLDGEVWISRVEPGSDSARRIETRANDTDAKAALLTAAYVPAWRTVSIDRDLPQAELDEFLKSAAASHALGANTTFPFMIEGDFAEVRLHVVNKGCPMSAGDATEPYRATLRSVRGLLLGFYSAEPPGVFTHHGSNTHLHVLIKHPEPITGHVDAVTIGAGSKLRLPRQ